MMKELVAPLRIDFAGGWIDVPEFSERYPGYVVNVAIKPYISMEGNEVNFGPYRPRGGVSSSTGAYALSELKGIIKRSGGKVHCRPVKFAELLFEFENSTLGFKIGRQDQYAIVLGGLNCLRFGSDGFHVNDFEVETHISEKTGKIRELEEKLILVHSGFRREAQDMVEIVRRNFYSGEERCLGGLRDIAEAGKRAVKAVQQEKYEELADIMSENWDAQKRFAQEASTPELDKVYSEMMENGALGGKICGAGAGGYFVFYCKDKEKIARIAKRRGLQVIYPKFEMKDILTLNDLNPQNKNED